MFVYNTLKAISTSIIYMIYMVNQATPAMRKKTPNISSVARMNFKSSFVILRWMVHWSMIISSKSQGTPINLIRQTSSIISFFFRNGRRLDLPIFTHKQLCTCFVQLPFINCCNAFHCSTFRNPSCNTCLLNSKYGRR